MGLVCFQEAVPTQAMSAPPGLCWQSPQAAQKNPGVSCQHRTNQLPE